MPDHHVQTLDRVQKLQVDHECFAAPGRDLACFFQGRLGLYLVQQVTL
jgi:hypothetical protein